MSTIVFPDSWYNFAMSISTQEERWLLEEKYSGDRTPEFEQEKERLATGEPIAYVIGFCDFLGCRVDLSRRPLIPRPETEYWVEKMIARMREESAGRPLRCLDIFSGSGCIGIALLKHLPNTSVDFTDADASCLEQIRINLKKNNIALKRARIIHSDIFETIEGRYDYIFANPPYIAEKRKNRVEESVMRYEPARALWGGEDGLRYIRRFLDEVSRYLAPGGILAMEFDDTQKETIAAYITGRGFFHAAFHKDQYGAWRSLCAGHASAEI